MSLFWTGFAGGVTASLVRHALTWWLERRRLARPSTPVLRFLTPEGQRRQANYNAAMKRHV